MPRYRRYGSIAALILILAASSGCKYELPTNGIITDPARAPFYNLGITNQPADILIPIPPSDSLQYIVVENPHINTLHVEFLQRQDTFLTGDYFPYYRRPVAHRLFVIPIRPSNITDTARIILSKSGENLSFRIRLLEAEQWVEFQDWDNILSGIIIGFYFFLFLVSIFVLLMVRSRKSLLFSCFILFTAAWMLNDAGLFYRHFWPSDPEFHNRSRGLFSSLNVFAFGLYLYQDIHRRMAWGLSWVIRTLIGYLVLKVLILLMVGRIGMSESLKQFTLYFNAYAFTLIFGWFVINILYRIRDYRDTVFEALALLLISYYSFHLSLRELGLGVPPIRWLNGYDVFIFHALQALFIGLHIFLLERGKQSKQAKEMLDFKLEQERRLGERLLQAEESEKKRIARDIHDEIGSIFVSMKYILLSLREKFIDPSVRKGLDDIRNLSDMGIKKQYAIIDDLLLKSGEGNTLQSILQEKCEMISQSTQLHASLGFEAEESKMSEFQKIQIQRILSELMSNTIKHANASRINIFIHTQGVIYIEYFDNGIGISTKKNVKGMGLQNISHRLEFMHGTIDIPSLKDGSKFIMRIPLENA